MEIKAAQEVSYLLFGGPWRQALQVQERAGVQVQRFQLVLGEVTDGQVFATGSFTGKQRTGATQCIHKGGLAGAVRAQQADPGPRQQGDVNVPQDGGIAMARYAVSNRQQGVRYLVGHGEFEAERRIYMGRGNPLHALQCLDPALGLLGLGGLGLEPVNKALDFGNPRLLALEARLLLGQPLAALNLKGGIVAGVEHQFLLVEMHQVGGHPIHEIPVVGDKQQGAGVAAQPVLQPQAGVEVQVVGGLIQQQQV